MSSEDDVFANAWVQGWNTRDVEAVLSHYADDVEFQSPLAARLTGEPTGIVHIVVLGTYRGVNSRLVHFEVKGRRAVEVMELDGSGKVRRAMTLGQP